MATVNSFGQTKAFMKEISKTTIWMDKVKSGSCGTLPMIKGTYAWKDGRLYEGQWRNNRMNGCGKFLWPDGHFYEGEYIDDIKEGKGKFVWPDRRVFQGTWRRGKRNGIGTMTFADGKQERAEWIDDFKAKLVN